MDGYVCRSNRRAPIFLLQVEASSAFDTAMVVDLDRRHDIVGWLWTIISSADADETCIVPLLGTQVSIAWTPFLFRQDSTETLHGERVWLTDACGSNALIGK